MLPWTCIHSLFFYSLLLPFLFFPNISLVQTKYLTYFFALFLCSPIPFQSCNSILMCADCTVLPSFLMGHLACGSGRISFFVLFCYPLLEICDSLGFSAQTLVILDWVVLLFSPSLGTITNYSQLILTRPDPAWLLISDIRHIQGVIIRSQTFLQTLPNISYETNSLLETTGMAM